MSLKNSVGYADSLRSDVFFDADRGMYAALGNRQVKSISEVLNYRTLSSAWKSLWAKPKDASGGDGTRLGGVLVIGTGGEVVFEHREKVIGDIVDVDALVEGARRAGAQSLHTDGKL